MCLWPQTHLQIFYNLVFLADIPGKALTVGRSPKSTEMEASGFVIDCQQQRQMLGFMYNRNCQTKRMISSYLLRQLKKKSSALLLGICLKLFLQLCQENWSRECATTGTLVFEVGFEARMSFSFGIQRQNPSEMKNPIKELEKTRENWLNASWRPYTPQATFIKL